MKIIIPMSGFGERFRKAGYTIPKPLIPVDGKPIIAHVLDMFPGEEDIVFVCNREHLDEPRFHMVETLAEYCPTGTIVSIEPHKLGPVHAVKQIGELIADDEPTIVNYCDFTCFWDYAHFKTWVEDNGCAGAIPAYRGFHPHSLGPTNYAYLQEKDGWVSAIQEKQPFTNNKLQEYASSGTYYFRRGEYVTEYFRKVTERGLDVNGEYYVSLVYRLLIEDRLPVAVYDLQHFMQWGTPQDLAEYQHLSETFAALIGAQRPRQTTPGSLLIPMSGLGTRFANEGYTTPKPLIPVSGLPMVIQAARDLPRCTNQVFVLRQDLPRLASITETLREAFPGSRTVVLDRLSEGQAHSCLLAMDAVAADQPLNIGACDNGVLYERAAYDELMADPDTDVIVWGMRGHPNAARAPHMFGWIDVDEAGVVKRTSVKVPLDDPKTDLAIVGAFTFKRAEDFARATESMMARDARVGGEFYIDTCINDAIALGLVCRPLAVTHYLGWGTPTDLNTWEYWLSCFHKWAGHPYRIEKDPRVPPHERAALKAQYAATQPPPLTPVTPQS